MATVEERLRAYVGASEGDAYVGECLASAGHLVGAYLDGGTFDPDNLPQAVVEQATIEVAAELFHRRQAPGGITQFATVDGPSPVRMARNPMLAAYPILDPYLKAGLA